MPYLAFNLNNGNEFVFDLVQDRISLGRSPQNEIVIENIFISSYHAVLRRQADGNYEILDLKSTLGTFVNGSRISCVILKPQDKVRFGELDARYGEGQPAGPAERAGGKIQQEEEQEDHKDEGNIFRVGEVSKGATPTLESTEPLLRNSLPGPEMPGAVRFDRVSAEEIDAAGNGGGEIAGPVRSEEAGAVLLSDKMSEGEKPGSRETETEIPATERAGQGETASIALLDAAFPDPIQRSAIRVVVKPEERVSSDEMNACHGGGESVKRVEPVECIRPEEDAAVLAAGKMHVGEGVQSDDTGTLRQAGETSKPAPPISSVNALLSDPTQRSGTPAAGLHDDNVHLGGGNIQDGEDKLPEPVPPEQGSAVPAEDIMQRSEKRESPSREADFAEARDAEGTKASSGWVEAFLMKPAQRLEVPEDTRSAPVVQALAAPPIGSQQIATEAVNPPADPAPLAKTELNAPEPAQTIVSRAAEVRLSVPPPASLGIQAPVLAADMETGLLEQLVRREEERAMPGKRPGAEPSLDIAGAKAASLEEKPAVIRSTAAAPSDMVQLESTKAELAAVMLELEKAKKELESAQRQLAERNAEELGTCEFIAKELCTDDRYLTGLGKDRKEGLSGSGGIPHENAHRNPRLGRLMALTVLANLLALVGAVFWIHKALAAETEIRLAAYRPSSTAAAAYSHPTDVAPPAATTVSSGEAPTAPAPSALGEDLPPAQRELVLLKERNRLTAYADEAIATGVRASYDRLWEALNDPRLANLAHAARAEILRVQNTYLSGSRIDRFDILVGAYFPQDSGLRDSQLKDGQLIKLLSDATKPWEVRMKAANLLGTRRSVAVGDALAQAVKSDANLDVVKEATFSFEQLTGYHCKIFDAAALEKWWKDYKANPQSPKLTTAVPPP